MFDLLATVDVAAVVAGFVLGVQHGLGPDHCAALATLLWDERSVARTIQKSVHFGLGHAVTLGLFTLGAAVLGATIPEAFERLAEVLGGLLLIALGARVLRHGAGLPPHDGAPHDPPHRHGPRVGLAGAAFALSGVRGLLLSLPGLLLASRAWPGVVLFVLAFGLGVTLSMTTFGLVMSYLTAKGRRRFPLRPGSAWPSRLLGGSTVALGLTWISLSVA